MRKHTKIAALIAMAGLAGCEGMTRQEKMVVGGLTGAALGGLTAKALENDDDWVIIGAYVLHIPFAVRTNRWLAAHPETWDDKPRQRRAIRRASRREIRRTQPHRRSVARLGLRKPGR